MGNYVYPSASLENDTGSENVADSQHGREGKYDSWSGEAENPDIENVMNSHNSKGQVLEADPEYPESDCEYVDAEDQSRGHIDEMLVDFYDIEEYVQQTISKTLRVQDDSKSLFIKVLVRLLFSLCFVLVVPFVIIVAVVFALVYFVFGPIYAYVAKPNLPDWLAMEWGLFDEIPEEKNDVDPIQDMNEIQEGCYNIETPNDAWEGFPLNFDSGIYWYSFNNKCSKGPTSDYFDPNKKTVLYVHGWQCGSTKRGYREMINWPESDGKRKRRFKLDVANPVDLWIKKGYNVGIFYWNQYADESLVVDAERKIYNSKSMRWARQNRDGTISYIVSPKHEKYPVSEILLKEYINHFGIKEDTNPIHLVGHSIGTQLVLELTRRMVLNPEIQRYPQRLTLLDPYFSKRPRNYFPLNGIRAAQRAGESINLIRDVCTDMVIETYETSMCCDHRLLIGGYCHRFKAQTVHVNVNSKLYKWYNVSERHITTPHFYFCSIQLDGNWNPRFFNPSVSYDEIRKRMPNVTTLVFQDQNQPSWDSISCVDSEASAEAEIKKNVIYEKPVELAIQ